MSKKGGVLHPLFTEVVGQGILVLAQSYASFQRTVTTSSWAEWLDATSLPGGFPPRRNWGQSVNDRSGGDCFPCVELAMFDRPVRDAGELLVGSDVFDGFGDQAGEHGGRVHHGFGRAPFMGSLGIRVKGLFI